MDPGWKSYAKRLPGAGRLIAERDLLRQDRDRLVVERYACRAALARVSDERDRLFARIGDAANDPRRVIDSHLFVVTYGRSGSTLLQGILNSIPGALIRGENRQIALRLLQFHLDAVADRNNLRRELALTSFESSATAWRSVSTSFEPDLSAPVDSEPSRPWFGLEGYDDATAFAAYRRLMYDTVLRPSEDTRICGFKEIRWPTQDLMTYLRFLQSVFPGSRFIVNTRDLRAVSQSKWWQDRPDAEATLRESQNAMEQAVTELAGDGFHVHYDDWKQSPAALRPLFDWLGESYDEDALGQVLSRRHSY